MKCRLIIFDWDGTLMDSQAQIVNAMQQAFFGAGYEKPSAAAVSAIIGLSLEQAVFRLAPDSDSRVRNHLVSAYRANFNAHGGAPAALFPGVIETLEFCQRNGFELAVATGKSHQGLRQGLEQSATAHYFSTFRTADQCQSKPSPEMLEEILWELDVAPHEALLVGDTTFDLQMATNAGVASAAACYGAHPRHMLAEHGPVFYLDSITELPKKLLKPATKPQ